MAKAQLAVPHDERRGQPPREFAIVPGDTASAEGRLAVSGATLNPAKGEVLFVTVGIPELNWLELDMAKRLKNVDLQTRQAILGDRDPEADRQQNLQLMRYSKDFAGYVALSKLGYPVKVSGGGVVVDSLCMAPSADGSTCARQSPAAAVLQVHDVITLIDDHEVNLTPDLSAAIAGRKSGDKVSVTFKRGTDEMVVPLELTASSDGQRTIVGIVPNPSPPDTTKFVFPFDVAIDSGQVGGPSAGLAFTLAVLDALTPGELTGGVKVAATGEISPGGFVGEIGGLAQKTVAVNRSGAKVFLVPASQVDEARGAADAGLTVVPVTTLDDALAALAKFGGNGLTLGTPGATPHG